MRPITLSFWKFTLGFIGILAFAFAALITIGLLSEIAPENVDTPALEIKSR